MFIHLLIRRRTLSPTICLAGRHRSRVECAHSCGAASNRNCTSLVKCYSIIPVREDKWVASSCTCLMWLFSLGSGSQWPQRNPLPPHNLLQPAQPKPLPLLPTKPHHSCLKRSLTRARRRTAGSQRRYHRSTVHKRIPVHYISHRLGQSEFMDTKV